MVELVIELIGWLGMVIVVLAYLALSMGWWPPGRRYQAVNLFGSCAFIINGAYHNAWPSVMANVAWLVVAIVALFRARFPPAPAACLPGVAPGKAERLGDDQA